MQNTSGAADPSDSKTKYGFWIVVIGFVVVLVAFVFSALKFGDAQEAATALGSITGVIGTLAGTFFGVHVGAAGKEKADAERQKAQEKVERLAAMLPPQEAQWALNIQ